VSTTILWPDFHHVEILRWAFLLSAGNTCKTWRMPFFCLVCCQIWLIGLTRWREGERYQVIFVCVGTWEESRGRVKFWEENQEGHLPNHLK